MQTKEDLQRQLDEELLRWHEAKQRREQPPEEKQPLWSKAVEVATYPLTWAAEKIKEGVAVATSPWSPRVPGTEQMPWFQREQAEYEAWKLPSWKFGQVGETPLHVGVKGAMELLPWFAMPGIGQVGRAGMAARGIAGALGKLGTAGRVAGYGLEYSPYGLAEKAMVLPFKGVSAGVRGRRVKAIPEAEAVTPTAPAVAIPKARAGMPVFPPIAGVTPPPGGPPRISPGGPPTPPPVGPPTMPPGRPPTPPPVVGPGRAVGEPFKVPKVPLAAKTIADLRLRHPERLKAPSAPLVIVEEARRVHLYDQEIGNNALAPIMAHLQTIAPESKVLFGIRDGMVGNVGNPQNLSLAWGDVFQNYTKYTLAGAQKEYIQTLHSILDGLKAEATKHGIKIPEMTPIDEFWHWVPRKTIDVNNIKDSFIRVGAAPLRGKTSFMRERMWETMEEGIRDGLEKGYTYANPEETVIAVIKGYYRLIANKQAEAILKPITRVGKAKVGEAPVSVLSWFYPVKGGGVAIQQRVAMREVANAINKAFRPEEVPAALQAASQLSRGMVTLEASLDGSRSFIQGLMGLGKDFEMALKGKPSAIWARSLGGEIKTILNPQNGERFIKENYDVISEMVSNGIITSGSEFYAGLPPIARLAEKAPIVGRILSGTVRQVYGRFQAGWNRGSLQERTLLWKVMREPWLKDGGDLRELAEVVNKLTGVVSSKALGVGAVGRAAQSTSAFAPNWLRANLMILRDCVRTGRTANEMRKSVASTLGAMTLGYVVTATALGQKPKLNPLPKRYGGDGAEMFSVRIGDSNVGIPGLLYFWLKTLVEIGATAAEDPDRLIKFSSENPIVRIATYKLAPPLSLARELITGKDFAGNELKNTSDYLAEIVKSVMPIASQQILEPSPSLPALASEFAGLREFPVNVLDKLAQKEYGKNWVLLTPSEKGGIRTKYSGELAEGKMPKEERIEREAEFQELEQQKERDRQFQEGLMPAEQWRDALSRAEIIRATRKETRDILLGRTFKERQEPEYKALAGYYDLAKEYVDPKTGEMDFDAYSDARERYMFALPPEHQKFVEENLNPRATPLVKEFKQAQRIMRPYWEVLDNILSRNPGLKELWEAAQMNPVLARNPALTRVRAAVDRIRLGMRKRNPDIEKYGVMFYGWTPLALRRK